MFTSPLYGYTVTVGGDWQVIAATSAWDGTSAPGHDDAIVDQLLPPEQVNRCKAAFLCAPILWAYATEFDKSVDEFASQLTAADAAVHPCPTEPESQTPDQIDGQPAVLISKHCPAEGGILVLSDVVVKDGKAYAFYMQDPSGDPSAEPLDRTDFTNFITAVHLP